MRISHRLIIQSIAAAIALLGVGALGLLGVRHVQQELYVMTGDILPLKNQLLSIELIKEQTLNSLLALSHSSNQQEANSINTMVSSELEELQLMVDLFNQQEQIDEIDISAFIQTRNDILKNIVVNLDGIESYQNASKKALATLQSVSNSVKKINKGVQAIEQKSAREAQSARDNVNRLLSEQQKANRIARVLGKANVLLYATDAVQSKYKIGPTIERFSAVSGEIKALKEVALGHERIESSIVDLEYIRTLFSEDEVGFFARKKAVLEKEPRAKSTYKKILKSLSATIDRAERTNTQVIDDLEFEIVLANKKMSTALNFSSDPSSITSVNQSLTINTRDMQIGMQGLLAATDRRTLKAEYSESIARMNSLSTNAQKLTTELKELQMSDLSETADTIAQLISEVKKSVDLVHKGKLALFDGSQAVKRSIDSLNLVSSSQREHGQALVTKIDNMLSSVIESVDGKVSQSTSLIVVISFAAVLFSAAFSYITIRAIVSRLQRALHVAEAVSTGDLSAVEQSKHKDEITSVLDALARMVAMLDRSVRQIRTASAEVNQGAEEISSGNSALNDRNGQQAQHLNDTAGTTRKINELVQAGAGAIQQVSELSYTASTAANRGREVVQDAMHSMNSIESGAKEISNIISVIDSIAFQTNILALNAAVEASRAGEVGRGFAVVASEVRELASKSKESANQIKAIIDSNVAEVEAGSVLVNNAGEHINDVVSKVDEVKALIDNIAISSKQQVESIAHIDSSVDEIENMTQKNASLSEHTSDAASNLLLQARSLDQAVSVFRL